MNVGQLDHIETVMNVEQLENIEKALNIELDGEQRSVQADGANQRNLDPAMSIVFKQTRIKLVITSLARPLGLNVVFDETVKDFTIDVELHEVSLAKALDIIFQAHKMEFKKVDQQTIQVYQGGSFRVNDKQRNYIEEIIKEKRESGGEQASAASAKSINPSPAAVESMQSLNSSNPEERAAAACSLGRLGAVEAIPALINLLGDDAAIRPFKCWDFDGANWNPALFTFKKASPGEQAAIAIASMGKSAVEPLIAALINPNPSVRGNAAWAIGEIRGGLGTNRSAAVEPLIAALGDSDSWVRAAAAFSLGEMRPPLATESLIRLLGDVEWNVREMAARALGEMKVRSSVESLVTLLMRDENSRVRHKAAWALGEIRDPQALDALTAALNDQDQRVRATAKWAITEIRE